MGFFAMPHVQLKRWHQDIIDAFPHILKAYKCFIIKTPIGAGKTILASEIIRQFYSGEKVIVLCQRLVILEYFEGILSQYHLVSKLKPNYSESAFDDYDVLLSTSTRARHILDAAIEQAKLIIIDETHHIP